MISLDCSPLTWRLIEIFNGKHFKRQLCHTKQNDGKPRKGHPRWKYTFLVTLFPTTLPSDLIQTLESNLSLCLWEGLGIGGRGAGERERKRGAVVFPWWCPSRQRYAKWGVMNGPQPAPAATQARLALAMETERSFITQCEQTEWAFVINNSHYWTTVFSGNSSDTSLTLTYFLWRAQRGSLDTI